MGILDGIMKKQKTTQEIEEETERLEAEDRKAGIELSIAQKRQAAALLKQRGLSINHFGGAGDESSWQKALHWLKTH